MPKLCTAALDCAARGWCIFPLAGKIPLVKWVDCRSEPPTAQRVEAWWGQHPEAGVGLALGRCSGVVRLDADGAVPAELLQNLAPTVEFSTPSGGYGWLYAWEEGVESDVLWTGDGEHQELRLLSDGRYTVIPPSPHPDGGFYEWVRPPWSQQIAPLPPTVADALRARRAAKALRELELEINGRVEMPDNAVVLAALEHLPPGAADSYDTWIQVGMALKSVGEELLDAWDAWSRQSAKHKEGECARRWASFGSSGLTGRTVLYWAMQTGWRPPRTDELELTDVGNAARLCMRHGKDLLFCHPWGKWLVWDGRRWCEDAAGRAAALAEETSGAFFDVSMDMFKRATETGRNGDEAKAASARKRANLFHGWALKSRSSPRIAGALSMAQHRVPVLPDALDSHPWLLCCANGVVDLRTGELREARRSDLLTKLAPVEYAPTAACPRWEQFLHEVFVSAELAGWMQRLLGYCLTGSVQEHVLPILWGSGCNGKTTLLNAVFAVLGSDYACKAPRELLLAARGSVHPTAQASLFGRRLVAASETADGARLEEAVVKELTGGEHITARRMREDFWSFKPTHKVLLLTNCVPEVRGTDRAMWRRIKLVPFLASFEGREDRQLQEKLAAEAAGILAWMVRGCISWQERGLGEPNAVADATAAYRKEQDVVAQFLEDKCTAGEGRRLRQDKLMEAFVVWCAANKQRCLPSTAFSKALTDRGFPLEGRVRVGLELNQ